MRRVNMHEAKTHLSRLVEQAANGEPFVIANAGKPIVKVVPPDPPQAQPTRRWGFAADLFAAGEWVAPDDIKAFGRKEIMSMFFGGDPLADDLLADESSS